MPLSTNMKIKPFKIIKLMFCLFSSHLRIFHPYGKVTMTGKKLQILTFGLHLRTLSSEGSPPTVTRCIVYNCHLRRPATPTPIAERLAVELSLHVPVCRGWDSNTKPSACEVNALTQCVQAAA